MEQIDDDFSIGGDVKEFPISTERQLKLRNIQFSLFKAKHLIDDLEKQFRQEVEGIVKETGEDPTRLEFDSETLHLREKAVS
jgi:hypothetical protein